MPAAPQATARVATPVVRRFRIRARAARVWERIGLSLLVALVLSTQLLFSAELFQEWTPTAIFLGWWDYFVECAIVIATILVAVTIAEQLVRRRRGLAVAVILAAAVAAGAIGGGLVFAFWQGLSSEYVASSRFAGDALERFVIAGAIVLVYSLQQRAVAAAAALHRAEVAQVALQKQMLEARLQVMRAQIEPHFLFNTLANVKRLCHTDVDRGLTMLENLSRYLRAALPQMREGHSTLGQEADLAEALLAVLQIRMGSRLTFAIDVPVALRTLPFPPMMLLTLVENAIKHGLTPSPDGGRLDVTARREHGTLIVRVADTGVGIQPSISGGTGIGLANTRARLAALYGPKASLALEPGEPTGVVAIIRAPIERSAALAAAA
jgi:signal transduction histidine kinase